MDNLPPNQPQIPQQSNQPTVQIVQAPFPQTTKGRIIVTLGILALIVLILASLNYFNIFPKKQTQPPIAKQTKVPESTLDAIAKKTILNALRLTLNPALEADLDNLKFTQDKITKVSFTTTLETKKGPAELTSNVSPNGQYISSLYFSLLGMEGATPSASFTQANIASIITLQPKGTWGCQFLYDYQYCENFWEEQGVKKGVGVYGPITIKDKKRLTSFFCQFDQKSTNYAWKSCTIEFSKTGVK